MKKATAIIFVVIVFALYKQQHVRPVDDPKDTPIFQDRLKSSLDRFQTNELSGRQDKTRDMKRPAGRISPYSRSPAINRDLVATGRCGRVTLSWFEEAKVDKKSIGIKRKSQGEKGFIRLKSDRVYDRQEEQGRRFWAFDSGLKDDVQYEYIISYKDGSGKDLNKGPAPIKLTCNESDKEILAQREKMTREYYRKKGAGAGDYPAGKPPESARPPVGTMDLLVAGRCGKVSLTWVEKGKIDKEGVRINRRTQNEEYSVLKTLKVYDRAEAEGTRYWAADSGLSDGVKYEYLITLKDAQGKEVLKGPVSINLTCNARDKEMLAQREKMVREYYQKKGIERKGGSSESIPSSYQLSEKVYNVESGNSPQKGKKDAPVTLVVFTDFECIHCSGWAQTLDTIWKSFPQDVKVVFKNYTLSYHKNSEDAARAVLAAGKQGKFWEMHDLLFKNQNALSREDIQGYAKATGLDLSRFNKSLESNELKKIIDQDKAQGTSLGVKNVPTTFINGRSLVGSPPVSYIKGIIEDILE